MIPKFIAGPDDLVTPPAAVSDGFLWQAKNKRMLAGAMVDEAEALGRHLETLGDIGLVAKNETIRQGVLAAAGFSDKSQNHIDAKELNLAVRSALQQIAERAGDGWQDEIVSRYLLTRGDTLGGSMRNLTGTRANKMFASRTIVALRKVGAQPEMEKTNRGKVKSISWNKRLLLFDKKCPLTGNNIDVMFLEGTDGLGSQAACLADPSCYLACGELKAGIDPAGADEHWKTARSALNRIRATFGSAGLALFFAAAAIELGMAREIYSDLSSGRLAHAANLTIDEQLDDLISWLVSL